MLRDISIPSEARARQSRSSREATGKSRGAVDLRYPGPPGRSRSGEFFRRPRPHAASPRETALSRRAISAWSQSRTSLNPVLTSPAITETVEQHRRADSAAATSAPSSSSPGRHRRSARRLSNIRTSSRAHAPARHDRDPIACDPKAFIRGRSRRTALDDHPGRRYSS